MMDADVSGEEDLAAFEALSDEEQEEVLREQMCGLPLDVCLEQFPQSDLDARRNFVGSYGLLKIGTAAGEVLGWEELDGPEDCAELAILLVEAVTVAAREAGVHRHKLAAGLRGLARSLG